MLRPRTWASGPRRRPPAADRWAAARLPYLDNLKVVLIATIIAAHGVIGYASYTDGLWPYANVAEIRLSPVTEAVVFGLFVPLAVFVIALLFLIAGLLTPPSLARKGVRRFVLDRLLRLGVPFAVFTLLLWPLPLYGLYRPLGHVSGSYWSEFVGASAYVDTGPLWFVAVLLIFSLAYAAWVRVRPARGADRVPRVISVRRLLGLVVAVTTATFVVRLVFPFGSERFADLNFWEWPACIALFGLGVVASRQGWLTAVPDRLRRRARTATLIALAAAAVFLAVVYAVGVVEDDDRLLGGWHWAALGLAAIEGTLSVFGSVWLVGAVQRHLNRPVRLGPVLGRSAYGAFMVQGLVLIGLAVALRAVPVPAEIKALAVAAGGVTGSFALAWLLVTRVPGLARVL